MKMKKSIVVCLLCVITLLSITFPTFCNVNTNSYAPIIKPADSTAVSDFAGPIASTIQVIGTVISVGVMVWVGLRYMFASVEEKAEYKKTLLPIFIGAIIVFAISSLVKIIANIGFDIGS